MARVRGAAIVLGLVTLLGILVAPPAVASPSDGEWTFSGSLTSSGRTTSTTVATLSGTATVPEATLDAVACDDTVLRPPQGRIALRNQSTSSITALTGTGVTVASSAPTSVAATAAVGPGNYEVVFQYRCGTTEAYRGTITPSPSVTMSIASAVSTQSLTRACLPTTPETPCTSQRQQITHVPTGLGVTFAGVIATTWSDGAVTEEPVTGTQSLRRYTGSSWAYAASSCAVTITITASDHYRCSSTSGGDHGFVAITVMADTNSLTISPPSVSPITTIKGGSVRLQAAVLMTYSDGSQWPAPTSVQYKIEFLPVGGSSWTTLAGPSALDSRGNVSRSFPLPGTGRVRVVAGNAYSTATEIVEAVATSEFAFSDISLPAAPAAKTAMTATVNLGLKWTDNVVRDAPNGTKVGLQYAIAYTAGAKNLTWIQVAEATLSNGKATFSTIPQGSGLWRFTAGTSVSRESFVPVTGSRPVTSTVRITPVAGSEPFAGRSSRFQVNAEVSGYVGTDRLYVRIDLGGSGSTAGPFDADTGLSGEFTVAGPRKPGSVVPSFEVLDSSGRVWARSSGSSLFVDGLVTYEPILVQPEPVPLDGRTTTFTARMQGQALSGVQRDGYWGSRVELQRLAGSDWTTVGSVDGVDGSVAEIPAMAMRGGQYRVLDTATGATSEPLVLRVLVPLGPQQVSSVVVLGNSRVELGNPVRVTALVDSKYDDGEFYPAPDGEPIDVYYTDAKGEKKVATTHTEGGGVEITLRPKYAGVVTFEAQDGSRSTAVDINLVRPDRFAVTWPKSVRPGKGLVVKFFVRADDGPRWRKPVRFLFQFKARGAKRWQTLTQGTVIRGRPYTAKKADPQAGVYRVYSPQFKFFNDASYG